MEATVEELLQETQDAMTAWLDLAEQLTVSSDPALQSLVLEARRTYRHTKSRWLAAKGRETGQPTILLGSEYSALLSSQQNRNFRPCERRS